MHTIDKSEQQQYYDKWVERYTHSFRKIMKDGHEEGFIERLNDLIPNVPYEDHDLTCINIDVVQMRALIDAYKQFKELSQK